MLKIEIVNVADVEAVEVKNVSNMWKKVKELFAQYGNDTHIMVTDENGNPFKDLTIQVKKNGKTWMVNTIEETKRKNTKKAEDTEDGEQEVHTIDEAKPEKKAKKSKAKNGKKGAIIAA